MLGIDHAADDFNSQLMDKSSFPQSHIYIWELVTPNRSAEVFDIYNHRTRDYFKDEDSFTEYVYDFFNSKYDVRIDKNAIRNVYRSLDYCDIIYTVCKPLRQLESIYNFDFLEGLKLYQRFSFIIGLDITKQILEIVDDYNKQLNSEIELLESIIESNYNKDVWINYYKRGNKLNFLRSFLSTYFRVAGVSAEETKPSLLIDILSEEFPFTTEYGVKDKIYVNPYTFNKVVQELKKYGNSERYGKVSVVVGRPHLKFLFHFMKKKYPSSIFHVVDLTDNKAFFEEVDKEDVFMYIDLAEKYNLLE